MKKWLVLALWLAIAILATLTNTVIEVHPESGTSYITR